MMTRGIRRYLFSMLVAAVLPQLLLATAFAAAVPVGAESRALGLDPLLRDGPSLVFLYPQQAVRQPRQLLILDTGGDLGGMAGILAVGGQRLFAYSTREVVSAGYMSSVRAGWARQAGRFRVGLAAGGYLFKESSGGEQGNSWGTTYSYTVTADDGNSRSIEGLAGVGAGRGRSHLDLAWESRWQTADRATAELQWTRTAQDTTIATFEGDRRPLHVFHLRAGLPLGAGTDLLVAGQWGGRREHWKGTFRGAVLGDDWLQAAALTGWRDSWKAGAAVSFPMGEIDRVTVSAGWISQKLPEYLTDPSWVSHRVTSRRDGVISVSVEERLWRQVVLLAGLQRTYFRSKINSREVQVPDSASAQTDVGEGMGHKFAWGARWTHGGYQIGALVSNTLQLSAPFGSLDLSYRF